MVKNKELLMFVKNNNIDTGLFSDNFDLLYNIFHLCKTIGDFNIDNLTLNNDNASFSMKPHKDIEIDRSSMMNSYGISFNIINNKMDVNIVSGS